MSYDHKTDEKSDRRALYGCLLILAMGITPLITCYIIEGTIVPKIEKTLRKAMIITGIVCAIIIFKYFAGKPDKK